MASVPSPQLVKAPGVSISAGQTAPIRVNENRNLTAGAEAFTNLGKAISGAGDQLAQVGAVNQARDEARKAEEHKLGLQHQLLALTDEYGRLNSQDAVDQAGVPVKKAREAFNKILGGITNSKIRREFQAGGREAMYQFEAGINAHTRRERPKAEISVLDGGINFHTQQMVTAGLEVMTSTVAALRERLKAKGNLLGIPGKQFDAEGEIPGNALEDYIDAGESEAHIAVIENLLAANNAYDAEAYYRKWNPSILKTEQKKVLKALNEGTTTKDAQIAVKTVWANSENVGDIPPLNAGKRDKALLGMSLSADVLTKAQEIMTRANNAARNLQNTQDQELTRRGLGIAQDARQALDDLPLADKERLKQLNQWKPMKVMEANANKNLPFVSDDAKVGELRRAAAEGRLHKLDFWSPKFTTAVLPTVLDHYEVLKLREIGKNEELARVEQKEQDAARFSTEAWKHIKKQVDAWGLDTTQLGQFDGALIGALNDLVDQGRRPKSGDEFRELAAALYARGEIKTSGTNMRLFEARATGKGADFTAKGFVDNTFSKDNKDRIEQIAGRLGISFEAAASAFLRISEGGGLATSRRVARELRQVRENFIRESANTLTPEKFFEANRATMEGVTREINNQAQMTDAPVSASNVSVVMQDLFRSGIARPTIAQVTESIQRRRGVAPAAAPAAEVAVAKPAAPAAEVAVAKPAAPAAEVAVAKPAAPAAEVAVAKPASPEPDPGPAAEVAVAKPASPEVKAEAEAVAATVTKVVPDLPPEKQEQVISAVEEVLGREAQLALTDADRKLAKERTAEILSRTLGGAVTPERARAVLAEQEAEIQVEKEVELLRLIWERESKLRYQAQVRRDTAPGTPGRVFEDDAALEDITTPTVVRPVVTTQDLEALLAQEPAQPAQPPSTANVEDAGTEVQVTQPELSLSRAIENAAPSATPEQVQEIADKVSRVLAGSEELDVPGQEQVDAAEKARKEELDLLAMILNDENLSITEILSLSLDKDGLGALMEEEELDALLAHLRRRRDPALTTSTANVEDAGTELQVGPVPELELQKAIENAAPSATPEQVQEIVDKASRVLAGVEELDVPAQGQVDANVEDAGVADAVDRGKGEAVTNSNNPGNIRDTDIPWVGATGAKNGFEVFDTPEHGVRAVGVNLQTYESKYGLKTIEDIITKYAPPSENDTETYIKRVSRWTGIARDAEISMQDHATLLKMVRAILRQEGAGKLSRKVVEAGVFMVVNPDG